LTALDTNNNQEKFAGVVQLVDWAQVFDRECPQIGIQVRKDLNSLGLHEYVMTMQISYFLKTNTNFWTTSQYWK
jgi:hypothetical protein